MEAWTEWTDMFYQDDHEHTLDLQKLAVDQAYVHVVNNEAGSVYLYFQNEDCIECPYKRLAEIPAESAVGVPVDTRKDVTLRLANYDYGDYVDDDNSALDVDSPQLGAPTAAPSGSMPAETETSMSEDTMRKRATRAIDEKRWWKKDPESLGQFGVYQLKIGDPKVATETPDDGAIDPPASAPAAPPAETARQSQAEEEDGTMTAPEGPIQLDPTKINWSVEKEPVNIYSCKFFL